MDSSALALVELAPPSQVQLMKIEPSRTQTGLFRLRDFPSSYGQRVRNKTAAIRFNEIAHTGGEGSFETVSSGQAI